MKNKKVINIIIVMGFALIFIIGLIVIFSAPFIARDIFGTWGLRTRDRQMIEDIIYNTTVTCRLIGIIISLISLFFIILNIYFLYKIIKASKK